MIVNKKAFWNMFFTGRLYSVDLGKDFRERDKTEMEKISYDFKTVEGKLDYLRLNN